MSTQADIKSIDTLSLVKLAMITYAHDSSQALAEIEIEGQRGIDWITVDRAAFWKAETRRAADGVNQAIKDLEHFRTYKKVGDNAPACAEEKKNLEKARKKLQRAEEKLELVKRWTPVVLQQFRETCIRLVRFREIIDVDCPRAIARIEQMLTALENYQTVVSPSGANASGTTSPVESVARQTDDSENQNSTEESADS
jgi:hypothetical protein